MADNFDITTILEVSYDQEIIRSTSLHIKEDEVVLGLPAPDWVENQLLKEAAGTGTIAAERLRFHEDDREDDELKIKEEEELQIEIDCENSEEDEEEESNAVEAPDDSIHNSERNGCDRVDEQSKNMHSGSYSKEIPTGKQTLQEAYGCNTCSLSFSDSAKLNRHVRCHPLRRKPFCCRVCLKPCTLLSNLKRHMCTHSGERPFACSLCSKTFISSYAAKIHVQTHTGYKPFACILCPKSFYQITHLKKHIISHCKEMSRPNGNSDNAVTREFRNLKPKCSARSQEVMSPDILTYNYVSPPVIHDFNTSVSLTSNVPLPPPSVQENYFTLPTAKEELREELVCCDVQNSSDVESQETKHGNAQSKINATVSLDENNLLNVCGGPAHFSTTKEKDVNLLPSETGSKTISTPTTVNKDICIKSKMYAQSKTYCTPSYIPKLINSREYALKMHTSFQSPAVNNITCVPVVEPKSPDKNITPKAVLVPLYTPLISDSTLYLPKVEQYLSTTYQSTVVKNFVPGQQPHKPIYCNTCSAPVTLYTDLPRKQISFT